MTSTLPIDPTTSNEAATILVVDDDPVLQSLVEDTLTDHHFKVVCANTGKEALDNIRRQRFDLVVLDRRLPDCDGLSVLRQIRQTCDCAVIIVSVMGESQDRLLGLELGADDYINKPINPDEIVLRAKRCIASHSKSVKESNRMAFGDFTFQAKLRKLTNTKTNEQLNLSQGEATLLETFLINDGKVLDRPFLLNKISKRDWLPYDRTVDVLIARLRRKIENNPQSPEWIITVRGEGYQFIGHQP